MSISSSSILLTSQNLSKNLSYSSNILKLTFCVINNLTIFGSRCYLKYLTSFCYDIEILEEAIIDRLVGYFRLHDIL